MKTLSIKPLICIIQAVSVIQFTSLPEKLKARYVKSIFMWLLPSASVDTVHHRTL